jgi:NitT/TauT family transport system ATP-binding protein
VFGKSARLLADIHVDRWRAEEYAVLREAIQSTLQSNEQDTRLNRP